MLFLIQQDILNIEAAEGIISILDDWKDILLNKK